jgi:hypothetical protein
VAHPGKLTPPTDHADALTDKRINGRPMAPPT